MDPSKKIEELMDLIENLNWFASIGKPFISEDVRTASELDQAVTYWLDRNFDDACSVAWEAFRSIVVQDNALYNIWEKYFPKINDKVKTSISNSAEAKRVLKSTGQSLEEFCSQLPFLGAAGEILIADKKKEWTFYNDQLRYYKEGHWVCGWYGVLSNEEFIYPASTFRIF